MTGSLQGLWEEKVRATTGKKEEIKVCKIMGEHATNT